MKQVITFGPDGSVSGLQRKKGKGLDLRMLGDAVIVRASEIVFDADSQRWLIQILTGPFVGEVVTANIHYKATGIHVPNGNVMVTDPEEGILLFEDYDEAVAAEVAILDGFRMKGIF